jgi:hypothetical protein
MVSCSDRDIRTLQWAANSAAMRRGIGALSSERPHGESITRDCRHERRTGVVDLPAKLESAS